VVAPNAGERSALAAIRSRIHGYSGWTHYAFLKWLSHRDMIRPPGTSGAAGEELC